MKDLQVLVKPSSSMCNLRCKYCFYKDESQCREIENYGFMDDETLEQIMKKSIEYAKQSLTITYQGGEPTLCDLNFYKKAVEFQKIYNGKKIQIYNAIQTNGYNLTDDFIQFFKENNFLVGVSLDGTKETHDAFRINASNKGSYKEVITTIKNLKRAHVEFNILTVVHSQVARRAHSIYEFYKQNGLNYLQFIPCLNPIGRENEKYHFTLTAKLYEQFLKNLFDLWYLDVKKGRHIHILEFENYIAMLRGYPARSCGMSGICSYQHVIESDGEVYPCDFYVLDKYRLGNLKEVSYTHVNEKRKHIQFIEESKEPHMDCNMCKYGYICRGGCRRYREISVNGRYEKNRYCESYYGFFEYSLTRLKELAQYDS